MPRSRWYLNTVHVVAEALIQLARGRYLLAVSGGRDSMALLHAFAEYRRPDLVAVATFDHGTGPSATEACALVVECCRAVDVPVVSGVMAEGGWRTAGGGRLTLDVGGSAWGAGRTANSEPRTAPSFSSNFEARWRASRWSFLRSVSAEHRATIVTAHTMDDQAETVAMRILRGASARGLAAMAAPARGSVRPLLGIRRREVAEYAAASEVPYLEDPSNSSPAFLRNRLRADLLRAADAARPGFTEELVEIGRKASAWRRGLAEVVDLLQPHQVGDALVVPASAFDDLDAGLRAVVWPELAGRVGVRLDRRGVARAAAWSVTARAGQQIPLSGGASIERTARTFVVRPPGATA
ncbi:MAG: tRNA lysidine(34) synthetase TilS [Gemmatimonadaceae bacterium]